jgi:ATP-dependent Clp protease ATP-binding subunit ClpB
VGEPSVEDTIAILRGLKGRYEAHHGVTISDSALVAAASLSNRYMPSRQLPDKAIDLIDEAMSRLKMEIDSSPSRSTSSSARSTGCGSRSSLKKEKDAASKERLAKLREQMAQAEAELAPRGALGARARRPEPRRRAEEALDEAFTERDRALRDADYVKASKLEYETIKQLQAQLAEAERQADARAASAWSTSRSPTRTSPP